MSTYSFDTDDVFERERYARFLCSIIKKSDSLQRAEENCSYTICLDSGYGTGKSVFLTKLRNLIETDFDNSRTGVVSYNAWQNDFYDNAFIPFLYALLNDQWLQDARKADNAKGTAVKARRALANTGKTIAKSFIKQKFGEEVAELVNTAIDGAGTKVKGPMGDVLTEYKKLKKSIEDFNESLELCLIAWKLNKLVIIIDELDRCKPDFAIRTLEITKHLMNVKNVVFLFALDKNQLSKAVEKIYGQGMDADGYLCKFFDYISVMPKTSIKDYVEMKYGYLTNSTISNNNLATYITGLCNDFMLSIRDLDTIMMSYNILVQSLIYKYKDCEAHYLYLVCLVIKYKYPALYYKLANEQFAETDLGFYRAGRVSQNTTYIRLLEFAGKKIADRETSYNLCSYGNKEIASIRGIIFRDKVINYYAKVEGQWVVHSSTLPEEATSIDGLFFIEDRLEWNECKGMSYGMYIHKKLEMFNFEQPKYQQQDIDNQEAIRLG